jgi:glutamate synthase domain-containing protein 2/glutamate synthase domain-containing protein 1/glutamate synthase domain-containing protein 3
VDSIDEEFPSSVAIGKGTRISSASCDPQSRGSSLRGMIANAAMSHTTSQGLSLIPAFRDGCGVGLVVDLQGGASHGVIEDGMGILEHLDHRGARGAEERTGDGAGILIRKPHAFFKAELPELGAFDSYGVGQTFFPADDAMERALIRLVEETAAERHLFVAGWRVVPTDSSYLGRTARDSEPRVRQFFVQPVLPLEVPRLDVALYVLRRLIERRARERLGLSVRQFYICSLDRQTLLYKGMLTASQLPAYFPDLRDPRVCSPFALVHSRFSTNTLGAWHLAHPYRRLVHNGELNTVRGNENWMRAREADLQNPLFGADIDLIKPVIEKDGSDTAKLDNVLDLLLAAGRPLPLALRMLVPEAWENDPLMAPKRRAFYDFHSTLMEPWDGPALVVATDGRYIGAVLDRNGFRPCRWCLTDDGRLILASESGVLDLDERALAKKGRLRPGELLLVDSEQGRIVPESEVFAKLVRPDYGKWLREHRLRLPELKPAPTLAAATDHAHRRDGLTRYQRVFGYTEEVLQYLIVPMAEEAKDPMGAMGSDTPLAALSAQPKPLFGYFRQLFAQVSNPPLDFIRERIVTSLRTHLGRQRNILASGPEHCHQVLLASPFLTEWQLASLKSTDAKGIRAKELDMTFGASETLEGALGRLCGEAVAAIDAGFEVLVVSDRRVGSRRIPIPSLLAIGALHQFLVAKGRRTRAGLVLDAGEPCLVHHFCTLLGYGADAIHPWLAYQTLDQLIARDLLQGKVWDAHDGYRKALEDGLLKVMSKMGISTLQGYKGAQIFEAVGLEEALVERYFTGTPAHLPGIGLYELERQARQLHEQAFGSEPAANLALPQGGDYYWRRDGERHFWSPRTIGLLQHACRTGRAEVYRDFAAAIYDQEHREQTIRGLLELRNSPRDRDLDEVEPAEAIMRRFATGSMSFGALSQEAHEALAVAMNRIGGISGSGEGGEQRERFGTERSCSMKQVASGRFGVTIEYLTNARQIEIKMAQGSKPGEGGELPGAKMDEGIARVRFSTPGVGLISPPPHHDIYSIEDLAQLIFDLKCANPDAEIHVKLVACAGVGTIAAGVAKARADAVLISGGDGGTGASMKTSIKSAGGPWELGLAETQQVLLANCLRSRIRVRVDGGLKTGRDVVIAALLGAEELGFGTAPLIALGCIMLRKCHCNTCSVGVATQDPELRRRFAGRPEHVVSYLRFVAEEARELMATLGFRRMQDMIGRVDRLEARPGVGFELGRLLYRPPSTDSPRKVRSQQHAVAEQKEAKLLPRLEPLIRAARPATVKVTLTNRDRTFGTLLSSRVTRLRGEDPLPTGTLQVLCRGHAGQSFGAFLAPGLTLHLEGDANDYLGKGLSGGHICVAPPAGVAYRPGETVVIGNVALYGATSGEVYIGGQAGERFAVRNSGAYAVVEGVGDHGCEYMTGGVVVVLGPVGKNFAAGMSGGEAFVLDERSALPLRINPESVRLSALSDGRDEALVRRLLANHLTLTGSDRAARILADWTSLRGLVVKVMPIAYERVIRQALDAGGDLSAPVPPYALSPRVRVPKRAVIEAGAAG